MNKLLVVAFSMVIIGCQSKYNSNSSYLYTKPDIYSQYDNAPLLSFTAIPVNVKEMGKLFDQKKEKFGYNLKDPLSVMYRSVRVIKLSYLGEESIHFCGEVNAKNSYGGYGGYELFVTFDDELKIGAGYYYGWKKVKGKLYKKDSISDYCFSNGELI